MDKKEFPNIAENINIEDNLKPKVSGFPRKLFGITKFILGLCLLPFVYALSGAFLKEFDLTEKNSQGFFWAGVITFIIFHLFVYEAAAVYRRGHRLVEIVFRFFAPLVRVAPYLLPVYTFVIFIAYSLYSFIFKSAQFFSLFLFLLGFSLSLHLVFSARSVRSKQNDFLKGNYIFGFSFIYITNIILLAFCLNLVFKEFSFVNFLNTSFQTAKGIFYTAFKQLFLINLSSV